MLEASDAQARLLRLAQWLADELTAPTLDLPVMRAAQALQQQPQCMRIDALARSSGLGARRFRERFTEQLGMSPKRFARLCRFRALIEQVPRTARVEWAQVAADAGLHDQAHLVHEFKAFAGMTPGDWLAKVREFPGHVPV